MTNFLELEPHLLAHLKANVPQVDGNVFGATDLAGVEEDSQFVPALQVFYQGMTARPSDPQFDCVEVHVEQVWAVVVAVRNVSATDEGEAVRAEAGPLMGAALAQVNGYQPVRRFSPLALINSPRPSISAGYGYFPLLFRTRLHIAQQGA